MACSLQNPTPYHGVISPSPPAPRASAACRKTRCFVIGASVLTSTWSGLSWAAFGCSWSLLWVLSGSLWVLLGADCAPGGPLRLQLGALRVSLRTPKRFQNHLWIENNDFSKNRAPALINSTFLMVGGSVWELKIVPKRLRGEIKNDSEKKGKKKNETRHHPLPPTPVKLYVFASGPRCYCKNVKFYR